MVKFRVYKEKPYQNSNKEPFGVTINGKTKDFLNAHGNFKELVKKGAYYKVDGGSMNFLDVADMKGIDVAIVQVTQMDDRRGNAVYVYR